MSTILTSVNHAITLTKRLREISKNIENAEFNNLLADLSLELADTKLSLADMTEENAKLKAELTRIKHSKGITASELFYKDYAYFSPENDGPFCSNCYDTKKQKVRLKQLTGAFTTFGKESCPSCKETFG
jgi:hypothetical protein